MPRSAHLEESNWSRRGMCLPLQIQKVVRLGSDSSTRLCRVWQASTVNKIRTSLTIALKWCETQQTLDGWRRNSPAANRWPSESKTKMEIWRAIQPMPWILSNYKKWQTSSQTLQTSVSQILIKNCGSHQTRKWQVPVQTLSSWCRNRPLQSWVETELPSGSIDVARPKWKVCLPSAERSKILS